MASKNVVTLTFAGDSSDLEKSMDRVGDSADEMAREVDKASDRIDGSFERVGSGIDNVGEKGGDLESGFRGINDTMSGFASLAEGDVLGGLMDLSGGVEALAMGFTGVLVPALQRSFSWLAQTRVGMLAQAAASKVVAAATTLWSGAQRVLNAVLATNPIFLVIGAIAALVAIIVVIEKKTGFFSEMWHKIWEKIGEPVKRAWEFITSSFDNVVAFVRDLPGRIASAARGMFNGVRDAFKAAINWIIDHWNNFRFTIGPVRTIFGQIGPWHLDTPNIPRLHTGGIFRAPTPGGEGLALLRDRERVLTPGQAAPVVRLELTGDGTRLGDALVEILARAIRVRGGNVQLVLGGRSG